VRKRAGWLANIFRPSVFALLALAVAGNGAAAPAERVLRTPRKAWERTYDAELDRLTLVNSARGVLIDMRISDDPNGTTPDIEKLVQKLTGQPIQGKRLRMPQKTLEEAEVQMGLSFTLADGRRGMYREIWRQRADGRLGITGYLAIATEFNAQHIADFKLVRGLGNQLARGSVLTASLSPTINIEPEPVIAALPPVVGTSAPPVAPVIVATAPTVAPTVVPPAVVAPPVAVVPPIVAAPVVAPSVLAPSVVAAAVVTPPISPTVAPPVSVASVLAPPDAPAVVLPIPVPSALPHIAPATVPAVPVTIAVAPVVASAASAYPFVTTAGAGVPMGQVASILYAPLESSEVFVLFKDGSFHENLPVALEQWNLAASRSNDPSSWGKWKPAEDAGDFEMQYAADDVVTISATKIKPAKSGMIVEGSYQKSDAQENSSDEVRFAGNRFEISKNGKSDGGTYRIDGYSVIFTHDDGKVEHMPFFVVPPEEDGDDPAIWLGDSLLDRVE
jgi:hypothetical protein